MLPNFLVLGAPRTGTTWLHAVLSHHPQILVPDTKEPDFLNRRILSESFSAYTTLFDPPAGEPPRPLRGDMSVNYSNLRAPVVREIARLLPGARLIYTLRQPVDRLWSNLKYTYGTFSGRVMHHAPIGRFLRACHCARFTRRNNYMEVMRIWSEAFGQDALHVDLFDQMEQDAPAYVRRVLEHLGADTDWSVPSELMNMRIHSTEALTMPDVFRWYVSSQWLESTRQLNDALGGQVTHWVDAMEQAAAGTTVSRRLLRELNRCILSLPERLAYAAYNSYRERALITRLREVSLTATDIAAQTSPGMLTAKRPAGLNRPPLLRPVASLTPSQSTH